MAVLRERSRIMLEAEHDHEERFSRARVERATIMRHTWDTRWFTVD